MTTNNNSIPGGVSASLIKIPARPEKGGEGGEGGEGGIPTPPSPPSPPPSRDHACPQSNAEFLSALFSSIREGESLAVCVQWGDLTTAKGWTAVNAEKVDVTCPPNANNYFNCSTFRPDPDGSLRATKATFGQYGVLVCDDVGTKASLEAVEKLPPTYAVETSPGNFHYGYALAEPIDGEVSVAALQKAVVAGGLCDRGAIGLARWARLPYGVNGKAEHVDAEGQPFQCRLAIWSPDNRYTLDELCTGLGLQLGIAARKSPLASPHIPVARPNGLSHEVFKPAAAENPVVTELKARRWYKCDLGGGKHDITCPWVEEHTGSVDGGTAYFEPSPANPTGGFKCQHSHGDTLSIGKLLEELAVDDQAARSRAEIRYVQGAIDQVVQACDYVLSTTGNVFQSGGVIVNLRRAGSDCRSEAANIAELTMSLAACCSFEVFDRRASEWRRSDPPERVVRTLMGAAYYTYLPPLNGIARQPYYRPGDGTLVTTSGYDIQSGFYGAFEDGLVKLGEQTREAAEDALSKLRSLFSEFVFESPADEAAALSAVFTAVVRPYLPVAPAYLTTAPESGSGKSYLNSIIVQFAGGEPARASFPLTADEATKSVLAHLMSSPSCIEYDDMVCNFKPHATLNRVLTSESITDRVLGVSKTARVSTRTLFIGSGINVSPERDMNRRVITIRLASVPTNRIGRVFTGKPAELVHERRMEFVSHVLTIIEAWKAAGCPKSDVRPIASYGGEWADHSRHPLMWLDLPDPAQSLFDQVEDDNDGEMLQAFLQVWYRTFGPGAVTVRKVVQKAYENSDGALFEALEELPIWHGETVNRSKLGWYLSKHAKRIAGGLRLVEDRADGRRGWRVEKVVKVVPETPPSPPSPPLSGSS